MLLHTTIDMMRTEAEEGREVNHHGKTITVGGKEDAAEVLVQRVRRRGGGGGVEGGGGAETREMRHPATCHCGQSVQLRRLGREDLLLSQVLCDLLSWPRRYLVARTRRLRSGSR